MNVNQDYSQFYTGREQAALVEGRKEGMTPENQETMEAKKWGVTEGDHAD